MIIRANQKKVQGFFLLSIILRYVALCEFVRVRKKRWSREIIIKKPQKANSSRDHMPNAAILDPPTNGKGKAFLQAVM